MLFRRARSAVTLFALFVLGACSSSNDMKAAPSFLPQGRTVVTRGALPPQGNPPKVARWEFVVVAVGQRFCLRLEFDDKHSSGVGCGMAAVGPPIEPTITVSKVDRAGIGPSLDYESNVMLLWGVTSKRVTKIRADFEPRPLEIQPFDAAGFPFRFFVLQAMKICQRPFLVALDGGGAQVGRERPTSVNGVC
jgi:hypothetical protein